MTTTWQRNTALMLTTISKWLAQEPKTFYGYGILLISVFIFNIVWDVTLDSIVGAGVPSAKAHLEAVDGGALSTEAFLKKLTYAPIREELAFRAIPLWITINFLPTWTLLPVILTSSVIFALGHDGISSIFFQGVGGITLCLMFLKCGGMKKAFLKPYLCTVLVHVMINGTLMLGIF